MSAQAGTAAAQPSQGDPNGRRRFVRQLRSGARSFDYYSLAVFAESEPGLRVDELPCSTKVLLENLLRHLDGETVTLDAVRGLAGLRGAPVPDEVPFHPSRVLMPDSSGGPLLVDLAGMRDAVAAAGGDPALVNPLVPVDLVVDHSAVPSTRPPPMRCSATCSSSSTSTASASA